MIRERLYRDPVHNLILLDRNSPEDRTLMALIDAPEMQRLRRIRQLGLAAMAYPGAEHSRFTHSMGAMWLATRLLDMLGREARLTPRQTLMTRCAALLHDLGHGPLSHVFETFLGTHHEDWTRRIILARESGVNRILRAYSPTLPQDVASVIEGRSRPAFLAQIITSQLDADRFDYLLRDSAMTGVAYGIYDFERILHTLRLDRKAETIVVAPNGVPAVEKYLASRYHMYAQVYLHKTVRAAEAVLSRLLARAAFLASRRAATPLPCEATLRPVLEKRDAIPLEDYLRIDDDSIFSSLKVWENFDDLILSDLARRIRSRRFFKTLDISRVTRRRARLAEARKLIRKAGLDPAYYLVLDEAGDIPYRPYDPRAKDRSNHILVERPGEHPPYADIHDISPLVRGLTQAAFTTVRVMFPERAGGVDLRADMTRLFS